MIIRIRAAVAAVVMCVCLAGPGQTNAFAQDTGGVGTVSGTVVNTAGEPELAVTVLPDRHHTVRDHGRPRAFQADGHPARDLSDRTDAARAGAHAQRQR